MKEGEEEVNCKVGKITTSSASTETAVTTTTIPAEAFIVKANQKLTVRTQLLAAPEIVKVLSNKPFHVMTASFTKKAIPV